MIITWYGEACFKIEVKSKSGEVAILLSPFDEKTAGLKLPRSLNADIVLDMGGKIPPSVATREGKAPFLINTPGEFEVKGIFMHALLLPSESRGEGHIFWIEAEDIAVVHAANLKHVPSETELQEIHRIDILLAPIGGGAVLDGAQAAKLVSELEPRVVIPAMYKIPGLKESRAGAEPFLKAVGIKSEQVPKLKLAAKDLPADTLKVVLLEKT